MLNPNRVSDARNVEKGCNNNNNNNNNNSSEVVSKDTANKAQNSMVLSMVLVKRECRRRWTFQEYSLLPHKVNKAAEKEGGSTMTVVYNQELEQSLVWVLKSFFLPAVVLRTASQFSVKQKVL